MTTRTLIRLGVPALALALAACSAPVGAPPPKFAGARSSRDLDLVLPTLVAQTTPGAMAEATGDYGRRDGELGLAATRGDLGPAYYQGEPVVSLEEARWLYLNQDARRVIYFRPERRSRW